MIDKRNFMCFDWKICGDLFLMISSFAASHMNYTQLYFHHLLVVFKALRDACLIDNVEKFTFCMYRVSFLSYIVIPYGIEEDEEKIKAIKS